MNDTLFRMIVNLWGTRAFVYIVMLHLEKRKVKIFRNS